MYAVFLCKQHITVLPTKDIFPCCFLLAWKTHLNIYKAFLSSTKRSFPTKVNSENL